MKAVQIERHGDKTRLSYVDLPVPELKTGEALIRVRACALNHLDLHLKNGHYPIPLPHVSGSDVAGEIAAINGASDLKIGQAVVVNPGIPCGECPGCRGGLNCESIQIFGFHRAGGFAEYVSVPVAQVYAKPKNISFPEAAAFPLTFLTAWHMLVGRAQLGPGETVFIWGASGGLGAAAVQIARQVGAHIIAAARTEAASRQIEAIGADETVIYTSDDVIGQVKRLSRGRGADVVFESIGAKTWPMTMGMLAPHGRVVIAGATGGATASMDLGDLYYQQQTILGARMGYPAEFEAVLALIESGELKPTVDRVLALEDLGEAMQWLEDGKQMGKIIITTERAARASGRRR